jgi:hypothetical protein
MQLAKCNRVQLIWVPSHEAIAGIEIGNQLTKLVGLPTGHYHIRGHHYNLGLINSSIYKRCPEKDESSTHIVCNCEAIVLSKISSSVEPGVYQDTP